MSKRAEMRREMKQKEKENKTYTFTALELEQMQQRIRKEEQQKAKQRENEISEQIFKMMLVIPTNVLISVYWEKTAKKRIPCFVEDCLNLYESYTKGAVTMEEMQALTEEYAHIKL